MQSLGQDKDQDETRTEGRGNPWREDSGDRGHIESNCCTRHRASHHNHLIAHTTRQGHYRPHKEPGDCAKAPRRPIPPRPQHPEDEAYAVVGIRKAERSGVKAVAARNRDAMNDFYHLHTETRRRHGLPPQPAYFFLNIYEHIIKPGLGFTVLAQRESRPLAAAIFFRFGRNALYKYGASDKRFQEFRANDLVMWHGIQFLLRSGVEKLRFGRTERENEGLRRFKLSWGTQEEVIDYCRIDPLGQQRLMLASHNFGFHKRVFGRLPRMFNQLAGSIIYPHLD